MKFGELVFKVPKTGWMKEAKLQGFSVSKIPSFFIKNKAQYRIDNASKHIDTIVYTEQEVEGIIND